MKNLGLLLMLILPFIVFAQTTRQLNIETSRILNNGDQTQGVMPLLQEADRQIKALNFEEALLTLDHAVGNFPSSPEALISRAKYKMRVGMEREALIDFQKAERLNPYVADLYGFNGSIALLNVLAVSPKNAVLKLDMYQKVNYYYQVIDQYIQTNQINDHEVDHLKQVISTFESNDLEGTAELLEKPMESEAAQVIATDLKGILSIKKNNLNDAKSYFQKATTIDPSFAIAWYNLGVVELLEHNYGRAKTLFDKAINLQEDLTKAYFDRALVFNATGNYKSALADYNKIIDLQGTMYLEAYLNRGLTKKMAGNFNGALMDLNQIISEFPDNPLLIKNRANLNLLMGNHTQAIVDYTTAIKLDSNYSEAYYNRALAYFQLYDKVSACEDLEKSIELGNEKAQKIKIYFCTF